MSPLAKAHNRGRSGGCEHLTERFELFFNGMEVVNAYSEQNEADAQALAFTQ